MTPTNTATAATIPAVCISSADNPATPDLVITSDNIPRSSPPSKSSSVISATAIVNADRGMPLAAVILVGIGLVAAVGGGTGLAGLRPDGRGSHRLTAVDGRVEESQPLFERHGRLPDGSDDDLLTFLWEHDFSRLQYRYIELAIVAVSKLNECHYCVAHHKPLLLIDESYNANTASMTAALDVFAAQAAPAGRKMVILGDMLELGPDEERLHREIGDRAGMAYCLENLADPDEALPIVGVEERPQQRGRVERHRV